MWTAVLTTPPQLVGRPIYEAESMDGVITGGAENYMLLLADSEAFVIADRVGMAIEPIQHLFAAATSVLPGSAATTPTADPAQIG